MPTITCDDEQGHDAVAAASETPAKLLQRSRRRRELRVAPIQSTGRLAVRERWRSGPPAARDLSGQALGLIPFLRGRRARRFRLVRMKALD